MSLYTFSTALEGGQLHPYRLHIYYTTIKTYASHASAEGV